MADMEQKESPKGASSTSKTMSILSLNTTKAGMEGLDKEKINAIVTEASKGSKFYDAKSKNQEKIDSQVEELTSKLRTFSEEAIARAQRQADVFLATHSETRDLTRVIVHVDMDAFYAAVEEKDDPSLKTKPMAVGSLGMLTTSNYLARKFGVRAAMPGFIAKKLCPQLVIVPPNFQKYRAASLVVREVFREYDPNFCPMSLDEAYLDITEYLEVQKSFGNLDITPWAAVNELRTKIFERTELTASAGIAPNTFLAKVCSDQNKPNGQYELIPDPDVILSFVKNLPIRKVNGIGNVTEQLLKKVLNIDTCQDLYDQRAFLLLLFSEISSSFFLRTSIGIGNTQIGDMANRERKSMSTESTFKETSDKSEFIEIVNGLCAELSNDLMSEELKGSQLTVKIKTSKFSIKTRVANLIQPSNEVNVLQQAARRLLHSFIETSEEKPLTLRLIGVRMSGFKDRHDDIDGETKRIKQQATLDTFFAGPSRKTCDLQPRQSYQCPICGEDVIAANEEIFNKHLDSCLSISEKCADHTKTTNDNNFPTNKPQPTKPLVQDLPEAQWTCPVCESHINCDQMNVHLDECLNKPVISEIRHEQTQERKRQSDCDETKLNTKKAKTKNNNSNSILTYFSSR